MRKWQPYAFSTEHRWGNTRALSDDIVRTVLVVGDIHGERVHLDGAIGMALQHEADVIVQVGDFWLGDATWSQFTHVESAFMSAAHDSPVPVIVIDGNHEIWPSLWRYQATKGAREAMESRRPLNLGGSIWWAWRGSVWQWNGTRFGALGGAVSPDKRDPRVRRWRWPEEATTEEDLRRFIDNAGTEHSGQADVLFTHDAPTEARGLRGQMVGVPWDVRQEMDETRRLLSRAMHQTEPRFVIHGHWHQSNREQVGPSTEIIGLSEDGRRNHLALLTLDPAPTVTYLP